MTNVCPFPELCRTPADRAFHLKAVLRPLETAAMATHELVDLCERGVPGCSVDEIIAALREVAAEKIAEADELMAFHLARQSKRDMPSA
jgi:hypothetical protein